MLPYVRRRAMSEDSPRPLGLIGLGIDISSVTEEKLEPRTQDTSIASKPHYLFKQQLSHSSTYQPFSMRSEKGMQGLLDAELGGATVKLDPFKSRQGSGFLSGQKILPETFTPVRGREGPRSRSVSHSGALVSRNPTLLSRECSPSKRSAELKTLLGTSNRRLAERRITISAPVMQHDVANSVGTTHAPNPINNLISLEKAKAKARVEVDIELESEAVVEGGYLRGRMGVTIQRPSKNEDEIWIGGGKLRLVGFEVLASGDMRHTFFQHADSLSAISSKHHVLYASSPDNDGFCRAREGVHVLPFEMKIPSDGAGGAVRGVLRAKGGVEIQYIVMGSIKIKAKNSDARSIAHFYRHLEIYPYFGYGVLAPSQQPLQATAARPIFMGGSGKVHVMAGLHRPIWVAGQRCYVHIKIQNYSTKKVRTLGLALVRTITIFRPQAHLDASDGKSPGSADADACQTSTFQKLICESTLEMGKRGTRGHVTAKGWWTGVESESEVSILHFLLLPPDALSIPRGRLVEVSYDIRISVGAGSLSADIEVSLPLRIINFLSIDPLPSYSAALSVAELSLCGAPLVSKAGTGHFAPSSKINNRELSIPGNDRFKDIRADGTKFMPLLLDTVIPGRSDLSSYERADEASEIYERTYLPKLQDPDVVLPCTFTYNDETAREVRSQDTTKLSDPGLLATSALAAHTESTHLTRLVSSCTNKTSSSFADDEMDTSKESVNMVKETSSSRRTGDMVVRTSGIVKAPGADPYLESDETRQDRFTASASRSLLVMCLDEGDMSLDGAWEVDNAHQEEGRIYDEQNRSMSVRDLSARALDRLDKEEYILETSLALPNEDVDLTSSPSTWSTTLSSPKFPNPITEMHGIEKLVLEPDRIDTQQSLASESIAPKYSRSSHRRSQSASKLPGISSIAQTRGTPSTIGVLNSTAQSQHPLPNHTSRHAGRQRRSTTTFNRSFTSHISSSSEPGLPQLQMISVPNSSQKSSSNVEFPFPNFAAPAPVNRPPNSASMIDRSSSGSHHSSLRYSPVSSVQWTPAAGSPITPSSDFSMSNMKLSEKLIPKIDLGISPASFEQKRIARPMHKSTLSASSIASEGSTTTRTSSGASSRMPISVRSKVAQLEARNHINAFSHIPSEGQSATRITKSFSAFVVPTAKRPPHALSCNAPGSSAETSHSLFSVIPRDRGATRDGLPYNTQHSQVHQVRKTCSQS